MQLRSLDEVAESYLPDLAGDAVERASLALKAGSPLLIVGGHGSGKSALASLLARIWDVDPLVLFIRDANDVQDQLGAYVCTDIAGEFRWQPGPLLTAVRTGRWVIVEALEQVQQADFLLPLLEGRPLYVPATAELVEPAPAFRIIATVTSEDKTIPLTPAMAARWTPVFLPALSTDNAAVARIASVNAPHFAPLAHCLVEMWDRLNRVVKDLEHSRGFLAHADMARRSPSLRDFIRLCHRYESSWSDIIPQSALNSLQNAQEQGDWSVQRVLHLLSDASRRRALSEAAHIFVSYIPDSALREKFIQEALAPAWGFFGDTAASEASNLCHGRPQLQVLSSSVVAGFTSLLAAPGVPIADRQLQLAPCGHTQRLAAAAAESIANNEPLLFVGEAGCGKTAVVQALAHSIGAKLHVINLSQQSDAADLLGGFRPVPSQQIVLPILKEFVELFSNTVSAESNREFLASLHRAMKESAWDSFFPLLFRGISLGLSESEKSESHSASEAEERASAMRHQQLRQPGEPGLPCPDPEPLRPPAARPMSSSMTGSAQWRAFQQRSEAVAARVQAHGTASMAFTFIQGALVEALEHGDWILLDEINLAPRELLSRLSGLLESPSSSIIITERGDTRPVRRHPGFRLFAAMNPPSDVGKAALPDAVRCHFTELYVNDVTERVDLLSIARAYIPDQAPLSEAVDFFCECYEGIRTHRFVDGAGGVPLLNLRSFVRALSFARDTYAVYANWRRAVYEGFMLAVVASFDAASSTLAEAQLSKRVLGSQRQLLKAGIRPPRHLMSASQSAVEAAKLRPQNSSAYETVIPRWHAIGPGFVPLAPRAQVAEQRDFVITPAVSERLMSVVRAVMVTRLPILLQGPTSAGKTSLIAYLARLTGHRFVRINNHNSTDIEEYIGTYVPGPDGQLRFVEGALVRALREGAWVVLDELNLAPSDVLEALNRLLDDNRELYVPELREVVRPHPHFMLFATQNPPGLYGGRKVLSRAFRNRFVELFFDDLPADDLKVILQKRSGLYPEMAALMVNILRDMSLRRARNRVLGGSAALMTLRDLFRLASRRPNNKTEIAEYSYMLLAERTRDQSDRDDIAGVLRQHTGVSVDPDAMYARITAPIEHLLTHSPHMRQFKTLVWTRSLRRLFALTWGCVCANEPVLLVGGTGVGKTTVCQLIAALRGQELVTLNVHQNSETADFLGGLRPVRGRQALRQRAHDMALAAGIDVDGTPLEIRQTLAERGVVLPAHKAAKLSELCDIWGSFFRWEDGPLVRAMKSGSVFLIDEISLASDAVLERLNSVLEPERSLTLVEKGGVMDESGAIQIEAFSAHPDLRLLATMNPGGDYGKRELSPALRNRFTEVWVPSLADEDDIREIVTAAAADSPAAPALSAVVPRFMTFMREQELGNFELSVRDALAIVHSTVLSCRRGLGVGTALLHGVALVVLDGLELRTGLPLSTVRHLRQSAQRVVHGLLTSADVSGWTQCDFDAVCGGAVRVYGTAGYMHATETPTWGVPLFAVPVCVARLPYSVDAPVEQTETALQFSFRAPTVADNTLRVLRALQLERPILLEGSPGVGKTALVMTLARATGNALYRINLSDQTDISDLLGSDLPSADSPGHFTWRSGPLLRAMEEGAWVLLDELNLASQTVLEGLNSILDYRSMVFVPELGAEFHCRPGFRVFATQNPVQQGGGRKQLPQSFLNRFTQVFLNELTADDLFQVVRAIFPQISDENARLMLEFNSRVSVAANEGSIGRRGGPWEFNLRDVFRWIDLQLALGGSPGDYVAMLYVQRFRDPSDRRAIMELYQEVFRAPAPLPSGLPRVTDRALMFPGFELTRNRDRDPAACDKLPTATLGPAERARNQRASDILQQVLGPGSSAVLATPTRPTPQQVPLLFSLARAVQLGWPVLLVGPSGAGKSALVEILAGLTARPLVRFQLTNAVDTTELLGGFVQADISLDFRKALAAARAAALDGVALVSRHEKARTQTAAQLARAAWSQAAQEFCGSTTATGVSPATYTLIFSVLDHVSADLSAVPVSEIDRTPVLQRLAESKAALTEIAAREGQPSAGMLIWRDGLIVQAVEKGFWLLLEDGNFCSSAVLDRLNPLLEKNGNLVLDECGEPRELKRHPDFRLFMTVNDLFGDVSRAMRNRMLELFVSDDSSEAIQILNRLILARFSGAKDFDQAVKSTLVGAPLGMRRSIQLGTAGSYLYNVDGASRGETISMLDELSGLGQMARVLPAIWSSVSTNAQYVAPLLHRCVSTMDIGRRMALLWSAVRLMRSADQTAALDSLSVSPLGDLEAVKQLLPGPVSPLEAVLSVIPQTSVLGRALSKTDVFFEPIRGVVGSMAQFLQDSETTIAPQTSIALIIMLMTLRDDVATSQLTPQLRHALMRFMAGAEDVVSQVGEAHHVTGALARLSEQTELPSTRTLPKLWNDDGWGRVLTSSSVAETLGPAERLLALYGAFLCESSLPSPSRVLESLVLLSSQNSVAVRELLLEALAVVRFAPHERVESLSSLLRDACDTAQAALSSTAVMSSPMLRAFLRFLPLDLYYSEISDAGAQRFWASVQPGALRLSLATSVNAMLGGNTATTGLGFGDAARTSQLAMEWRDSYRQAPFLAGSVIGSLFSPLLASGPGALLPSPSDEANFLMERTEEELQPSMSLDVPPAAPLPVRVLCTYIPPLSDLLALESVSILDLPWFSTAPASSHYLAGLIATHMPLKYGRIRVQPFMQREPVAETLDITTTVQHVPVSAVTDVTDTLRQSIAAFVHLPQSLCAATDLLSRTWHATFSCDLPDTHAALVSQVTGAFASVSTQPSIWLRGFTSALDQVMLSSGTLWAILGAVRAVLLMPLSPYDPFVLLSARATHSAEVHSVLQELADSMHEVTYLTLGYVSNAGLASSCSVAAADKALSEHRCLPPVASQRGVDDADAQLFRQLYDVMRRLLNGPLSGEAFAAALLEGDDTRRAQTAQALSRTIGILESSEFERFPDFAVPLRHALAMSLFGLSLLTQPQPLESTVGDAALTMCRSLLSGLPGCSVRPNMLRQVAESVPQSVGLPILMQSIATAADALASSPKRMPARSLQATVSAAESTFMTVVRLWEASEEERAIREQQSSQAYVPEDDEARLQTLCEQVFPVSAEVFAEIENQTLQEQQYLRDQHSNEPTVASVSPALSRETQDVTRYDVLEAAESFVSAVNEASKRVETCSAPLSLRLDDVLVSFLSQQLKAYIPFRQECVSGSVLPGSLLLGTKLLAAAPRYAHNADAQFLVLLTAGQLTQELMRSPPPLPTQIVPRFDVLDSVSAALEAPAFYQPNIPELRRLIGPVTTVRRRTVELLQIWPTNTVLVSILEISARLLALPATKTLLSEALGGVESLFQRCIDWNQSAPRRCQYDEDSCVRCLFALIVGWRRIELQSWPQLLRLCERSSADSAARNLAPLLRLVDEDADSEAVYRLVQSLVMTSQVGQLAALLRYVSVAAKYAQLTGSATAAALAGSGAVFAPLLPEVAAFLQSRRDPLCTQLRDQIRLQSWDERNIHILRKSLTVQHRHIAKIMRQWIGVLQTPVSTVVNSHFRRAGSLQCVASPQPVQVKAPSSHDRWTTIEPSHELLQSLPGEQRLASMANLPQLCTKIRKYAQQTDRADHIAEDIAQYSSSVYEESRDVAGDRATAAVKLRTMLSLLRSFEQAGLSASSQKSRDPAELVVSVTGAGTPREILALYWRAAFAVNVTLASTLGSPHSSVPTVHVDRACGCIDNCLRLAQSAINAASELRTQHEQLTADLRVVCQWPTIDLEAAQLAAASLNRAAQELDQVSHALACASYETIGVEPVVLDVARLCSSIHGVSDALGTTGLPAEDVQRLRAMVQDIYQTTEELRTNCAVLALRSRMDTVCALAREVSSALQPKAVIHGGDEQIWPQSRDLVIEGALLSAQPLVQQLLALAPPSESEDADPQPFSEAASFIEAAQASAAALVRLHSDVQKASAILPDGVAQHQMELLSDLLLALQSLVAGAEARLHACAGALAQCALTGAEVLAATIATGIETERPQEEQKTREDGQMNAAGGGFSDGVKGENNVSREAAEEMDEDALLGNQGDEQQQSEGSQPEDEEGIEMDNDFGGDAQELEQKKEEEASEPQEEEEGEELEKAMDSVGDEADEVDERMWRDGDEQDEKETRDDRETHDQQQEQECVAKEGSSEPQPSESHSDPADAASDDEILSSHPLDEELDVEHGAWDQEEDPGDVSELNLEEQEVPAEELSQPDEEEEQQAGSAQPPEEESTDNEGQFGENAAEEDAPSSDADIVAPAAANEDNSAAEQDVGQGAGSQDESAAEPENQGGQGQNEQQSDDDGNGAAVGTSARETDTETQSAPQIDQSRVLADLRQSLRRRIEEFREAEESQPSGDDEGSAGQFAEENDEADGEAPAPATVDQAANAPVTDHGDAGERNLEQSEVEAPDQQTASEPEPRASQSESDESSAPQDHDMLHMGEVAGLDEQEQLRVAAAMDAGQIASMQLGSVDMELWQRLMAEMSPQASRLAEALRAILTPTQVTALEGFYRTGKRISMRRVVPFIASGFRKDRIWLRRSKPARRSYQIALAIDNSLSMRDSGAAYPAQAALFLVVQALTTLEAGQIGVFSFGDQVRELHALGSPVPASANLPAIVNSFTFEEESSDFRSCLATLSRALQRAAQASNDSSLQLLLIISDGRIQDKATVTALVRAAQAHNQLPLLILLDPAGATDPRQSVFARTTAAFNEGRVQITKYLDSFPFPHYLVCERLQELPELLSDALRSAFELFSQ